MTRHTFRERERERERERGLVVMTTMIITIIMSDTNVFSRRDKFVLRCLKEKGDDGM
jgi:hypothetical protein